MIAHLALPLEPLTFVLVQLAQGGLPVYNGWLFTVYLDLKCWAFGVLHAVPSSRFVSSSPALQVVDRL